MEYYAVVGNPVAHSKSPLIHAAFAEQTSQSIRYDKLESPLETFEKTVADFFSKPDHRGLNVTVPFKERAYAMCKELSPRARLAGAVNTLMINQAGALMGDNTDGAGLVRDIVINHGFSIRGKKVLVLGAGGAVRGVLAPILNEKPQEIRIWNRTAEKADALAELFRNEGTIASASIDDLSSEAFDLIINGTAASLSGDVPPIPDSVCGVDTLLYDMMYGAKETAFLEWGRDLGAGFRFDGLGMLVEQAAEAFYLWRGVRPDTAPVIRMLTEN